MVSHLIFCDSLNTVQQMVCTKSVTIQDFASEAKQMLYI